MPVDDLDPPTGPGRNPYRAPEAPIGLAWTVPPVDVGLGSISVPHDLDDDDLRLWVNFDAFFDPKPLFGLIPQWVILAVVPALAGGLYLSAQGNHPLRGALGGLLLGAVGGLLLGVFAVAAMTAVTASNRRGVLRSGCCEGRTLTVGPAGLAVTTGPLRRRLTPAGNTAGLGPQTLPWAAVRLVEVRHDAVFFWVKTLEHRRRLVLPRRAFASPHEADAFLAAAVAWHAAATGESR